MDYDQSNRVLKITTELGDNAVRLTELDGIDELSKPFVFRIKMVTSAPIDAVKALLSTKTTLEFGPEGTAEGRRKFRGVFRRLKRTVGDFGPDKTEMEWQAEVVPQFWFMTRRSNIKIYKEVTLGDIVQQTFSEYGYMAPDIGADKFSSQILDYCVQYRESDFDFLSRMMEKFGWFYFHDHADDATKLVICDTNVQGKAWAGAPATLLGSRSVRSVWTLEDDFSVQSGQWSTRDFDYEVYAEQTHVRPAKLGGTALNKLHERYDYPGAYFEKSGYGTAGLYAGGNELTDIAMEREEARHHLRRGTSDLAQLDAGCRLKIEDPGVTDPEVLVTWIRHRAQDYSHWTDSDWAGKDYRAPSYENEFVCLPQTVQFRPEASTPRPFVRGPQTATVIDGADSEPDRLGRVRVKFHWDRDDVGSCWMRVSQGWAGAGFGQIHLPRVGEEVIVDFLEGDPDRPIITGRVYNGENKVPYALPANKTQYGIKTNSIGGSGFNELRFDDKGGAEEIFVHAQKDLNTEVENNETREVGLSGSGDRTTTIKNNDALKVLSGNYTAKIEKGGVTIEAATEIVLKVGANKVTINTQGVTVEGTMVEMKGTASAKVDSPMTTAGGSGMTKVTGSTIMIG